MFKYLFYAKVFYRKIPDLIAVASRGNVEVEWELRLFIENHWYHWCYVVLGFLKICECITLSLKYFLIPKISIGEERHDFSQAIF